MLDFPASRTSFNPWYFVIAMEMVLTPQIRSIKGKAEKYKIKEIKHFEINKK
jgi:hypothetical protein